MPAAAKYTEAISTGHSCFPPTEIIYIPDMEDNGVFVNGKPIVTVESIFRDHSCGKTTHSGNEREIIRGSASCTIGKNRRSAARFGDPVRCGDYVSIGSSNVYIGD